MIEHLTDGGHRDDRPSVDELRRTLAPLAFDGEFVPDWSRLKIETHPTLSNRRTWRAAGLLAAAAVLIVAVGAGALLQWRLAWPAGNPWPVASGAPLLVGSPRIVENEGGLQGAVARLGSFDAGAGTRLTLTTTRSDLHQLQVERGRLFVRLWSPPGRLRVQTPAGDVVDLGCAFALEVSDAAVTSVRVTSGWIQLTNRSGETLVPEGASSEMRVGVRALVPVFDDAAPQFRTAVRRWESEWEGLAGATTPDALSSARTRDVYTLLLLAERAPAAARSVLVATAARLSPPPSGVDAAAVGAGNSDQLWAWIDSLPLPPVKGWWRNWRDGLTSVGW